MIFKVVRSVIAVLSVLPALGFGVGPAVAEAQQGQSQQLIANSGFEDGATGWTQLWTRDANGGAWTVSQAEKHGGNAAALIHHTGARDWSMDWAQKLDVAPGDIFELVGWAKTTAGTPSRSGVILCVSTWTADGKVQDWLYGGSHLRGQFDWKAFRSRFIIPEGVVKIQLRIVGEGPSQTFLDDITLAKTGSVAEMKRKRAGAGGSSGGTAALPVLPEVLTLGNAHLSVAINTRNAGLVVTDKRTGRQWKQKAMPSEAIVLDVLSAQSSPASTSTGSASGPGPVTAPSKVDITFLHPPSFLTLRATVQMEASAPEFTVELAEVGAGLGAEEEAAAQPQSPAAAHAPQAQPDAGGGSGEGGGGGSAPLLADLRFPGPFLSEAGQHLVVPMNEGISYPVDDASIKPMELITYGGHGICMAFWGVTDGKQGQGHMAIVETPDDARIHIHRQGELLTISPEWEPSMRSFRYARRLRYIFIDKGGHVAMAKRYRAYAKQIGLVRTLEEKRRENPNIDLLIGAANVWCWDKNALELVKEMHAAGIDRILWSEAQSPEVVRAMNEIPGVLTSRYDIYSDVMDPATYPMLQYTHPDWPAAAWPQEIVRKADGTWLEGWEIEGKDGKMYPCGVVNDVAILKYARERIPAEQAIKPYTCRFIDTTTATPWREDYSPAHPMTRTQSRKARMELLSYVSQTLKLVTGCETGHDAAVPHLAYFEGMLSLGPYRVPDAGRAMSRIWHEVPPDVAKFQMGHTYRLPLWELVYHDCVVAQWYWGDYNNKLPALWDKRDLFNVLYGTPPMFMFYQSFWKENKARFIQSYRTTAPVARATGYSEMTDHRFLTPDRAVQQTAFSNGTTITVNFGDKPWPMPGGTELKAGGFHVEGPGAGK